MIKKERSRNKFLKFANEIGEFANSSNLSWNPLLHQTNFAVKRR